MTQLPIARIEGTATPSSARTVKTSCAAWACGRDPGRPAGTCGKNTVDLFMKLSMKSLQGDVQKNVDAHTVEDFMRINMVHEDFNEIFAGRLDHDELWTMNCGFGCGHVTMRSVRFS